MPPQPAYGSPENIIRETLTSATAAPARTMMIMAKAFIFDDTSWKLLDQLKAKALLSFWVG